MKSEKATIRQEQSQCSGLQGSSLKDQSQWLGTQKPNKGRGVAADLLH